MTKHIVFVYGSLKSGFQNHRYLAAAEPLGTGRSVPRYYMVNLQAYPAIVDAHRTSFRPASPGSVSGELYSVDDATLAALDHLEGHPRYYVRRLCRVLLGDAGNERSVMAWIYEMPAEYAERLVYPDASDEGDACPVMEPVNGVLTWRPEDFSDIAAEA